MGREDGIAEGKAKGIVEGKLKTMEESAVRMHTMGMAIDTIAACLGESVDNITAWISVKTSMA